MGSQVLSTSVMLPLLSYLLNSNVNKALGSGYSP